MANYLKEMSVGEIIDGSVRLYFRHFGTIFLIYLLPLIILEFILLSVFETNQPGAEVQALVAQLVRVSAAVLASAAITVAVSDACLGHKPGVARSYRRMFEMIGRVAWTYLLLMIAIIVGLALLIVPGIILSVMLLFAMVVVILERRGGIDAFKRSIALGKNFYLRNFGVLVLAMLIAIVGQFLIGFLVGILIYFSGEIEQPGMLTLLLISLVSNLLGPVPLIATVLLYYDVRVRKENYDSAALAQDLVG